MNKKERKELKAEYELIVDKYIKEFERKHKYCFSGWVADEVGGIAEFIEQYFFNFDTIKYDIDNNIEKELIFRWQDDGVNSHYKNENRPEINFKSYVMGLRYEAL